MGPQWLLDGVSRAGWASKKVARAISAWEGIVNRPRLLLGMAGDSPQLKEFEHHPAGHWLRLGSPPYLYRG